MSMTFKEFLNAMSFKPQSTLLKKQIGKETGLQVTKDYIKPKKKKPHKLSTAVKPSILSTPASAALRKQRDTNPKNRFKIRKGSSLDGTTNSL